MSEIGEFFEKLFQAESWPARWYCGTWTDFHGWLYIFSNLAIWAAYFTIPLILFMFIVKRRHDIPYIKIFWLFIAFILTCGLTHLIDASLFYYPAYRFAALGLFSTAVISWATVFGLIKILPDALKLQTPTQLEQVINSRTAELQKVSTDLARQNEQLKDFAQIISHNLRAPVSNLSTLLDLYKVDSANEQKEAYIEQLGDVSDKLLKTISDLSEVVNIRTGNEIKKETLSFQDVFNDTKESLSAIIDSEEAEVTANFSQLEEIEYNSSYLHSIFLNLLSNALKYKSPERKPKVHFETYRVNNKLVLTCKDNGLGIDLNKYGDKIFKLNKTFHNNSDARGVGLFITKNQIETMGGTISVESEVNTGSTFIINLN